MNHEIIDTRIRAFQTSKSLEDMNDHAWQLAVDLGEMAPGQVVEVVYTSRASWISPMLAFARRALLDRNINAMTALGSALFSAGAMTDEVGLLPHEILTVAEREVFQALHAFDQIVTVKEYLNQFYHDLSEGSEIMPLGWEPEHLSWLSATYAQQQLHALPAHLRGPFEVHCRHWYFIASNGREVIID
jgi:hypothetical protein